MLTQYDVITIVPWLRTTCVRILALSFINCVTWGKLPNLSGSQLSQQEVEIIKVTYLIVLVNMLTIVCGAW